MTWFDGSKGLLCKGVLACIVAGIAIRFILGVPLTYNFDVYHWTLTISNFEGGNGLYGVAGYYYTPVWGYVLGAFSQVAELFGVGFLGERLPELLFTELSPSSSPHSAFVTSMGFNAAMVFLTTAFDLIAGYLVYWVVRRVFDDSRKAQICFCVWFLCPFVITVGAVGGMFDSLSAILTLLVVALLLEDRDFLAGLVFGMCILLKFFPAFLVFILVAYIIVKHRGDWVRHLVAAGAGTAVMAVLLMLPNILEGNIMDCFTFLTDRVSTATPTEDAIKYVQIACYGITLVVELAVTFIFVKRDHRDIDRSFLWYAFVCVLAMFVYPGTPQYVLLLTPFLIIVAVIYDRRLGVPLAIMMVGTTLFSLCNLAVDMSSLMAYTDLLPFDTWLGIYEAFEIFVPAIDSSLLFAIGDLVQQAGIYLAIALVIGKVISNRRASKST